MLKSEEEHRDTESIFYEYIFALYTSHSNSADNKAISLMNFVKKYEERNGKIIERTKKTFVIAFPSRISDPSSQYYHYYCKNMLIKHKPWRGQVCSAWGGPIVDPETGKTIDNEELDIFKKTYKTKFDEFKTTVDIVSLNVFNADADRLQRIRE